MKKIKILIALSILIILLFIFGCVKKQETTIIRQPAEAQNVINENDQIVPLQPVEVVQDPNSGSPKQIAQDTEIDIKGFSFNPSTIIVKKGTAVTWTQKDTVKHNIVFDDGSESSPLLTEGERWSYTFDKVGEYPYHCGPHPYMKGRVIVQ